MVGFIRELNFFHPDQETVQALVEQILKADFSLEHGWHNRNKDCIIAKSNEFKAESDKILTCSATSIISIAHGGQRRKSPVETEHVERRIIVKACIAILFNTIEIIHIEPWFSFISWQVWVILTQKDP